MNIGIMLRLLITAIVASFCFRACHEITGYMAGLFTDRPLILHKKPWLGRVAGILSVVIPIVLIWNGFMINGWIGGIAIFFLWWMVTNPTMTEIVKKIPNRPLIVGLLSSAFIQLYIGIPLLIIVTIFNIDK